MLFTYRDTNLGSIQNNSIYPLLAMLCSNRDEVTAVWRTLHNEELCDLHFSPNIIRVIQFRKRWGGACSTYGREERAYRDLVGKPEGRATWKTYV